MNIAKNVGLESAGEIVEEGIDGLRQLNQINKETLKLISQLGGWVEGDPQCVQQVDEQQKRCGIGTGKNTNAVNMMDHRQLLLKSIGEARMQIRLSLEIMEALHSIEEVEQFQKEVTLIIASQSPEVRREILEKLKAKRLLRSAVRLT
ncbi:MAG: hypothetical protein GY852_04530 [bacterium]|nr:hypothetical protein [bacterium]